MGVKSIKESEMSQVLCLVMLSLTEREAREAGCVEDKKELYFADMFTLGNSRTSS